MSRPTKCVKVALKPGSLPAVREWAMTLNSRRPEVYATLQDEGVVVETVFLEQSADGDYLVYFVKAESLEQANEVAARSSPAIDAFHKQFQRDNWGERRRLELLIDFDRIANVGSGDDNDA
jgi:Family of unknown function (DUF6176)